MQDLHNNKLEPKILSRVWNHGTCITKALEKNKSIFFWLGGGGGGAYTIRSEKWLKNETVR